MDDQVLMTSHHRQALRNACERGFWMPMALSAAQAGTVNHLIALAPGDSSITAIAPVTAMEPWIEVDGIESFLPFLGKRQVLPKPIPLGDTCQLKRWLPKNRDELQLIPRAALWVTPDISATLGKNLSEILAATRAA